MKREEGKFARHELTRKRDVQRGGGGRGNVDINHKFVFFVTSLMIQLD